MGVLLCQPRETQMKLYGVVLLILGFTAIITYAEGSNSFRLKKYGSPNIWTQHRDINGPFSTLEGLGSIPGTSTLSNFVKVTQEVTDGKEEIQPNPTGTKFDLMSFLNQITQITENIKTTKRLKKVLEQIPNNQRNEEEIKNNDYYPRYVRL